jgi:hypothetical protein
MGEGEEVKPCPDILTLFTLTLTGMGAARLLKTFVSTYETTRYYSQRPQSEQLQLWKPLHVLKVKKNCFHVLFYMLYD